MSRERIGKQRSHNKLALERRTKTVLENMTENVSNGITFKRIALLRRAAEFQDFVA